MGAQVRGLFFLFLLWTCLLSGCAGPAKETKGIESAVPDRFVRLTLNPLCSAHDPVIASIQKELEGYDSVLSLLEFYQDELKKDPDTGSPYYAKLERLFACGIAPEAMEGFFYGLTIYLKKGEHPGGEFLNSLWGYSLAPVSPWVGKFLRPAHSRDLELYTQGAEKGDIPTFIGINCFQEYPSSFLNRLSMSVLSFWLNLKAAPSDEKKRYGYDKKGGLFVARKATSIDPDTKGKEVFQLNYRWRYLKNPPPVRYLVDEMVEIADGLYQGKLVYATRKLTSTYDPAESATEYGYQNYGYFLLMTEDWHEMRCDRAPRKASPSGPSAKEKLQHFTFLDACKDDPQIMQIRNELVEYGTVLDLLKFYSAGLGKNPSTESPYFQKLQKIFSCGKAPVYMEGYLHGAVVAFRNEGFLKFFDLNTLNLKWPLARLFSPWTGKTFEPIQPGKLQEVTQGLESGSVPTFWGANTYSIRWPAAKMAVETMRTLGIELEKASYQEIRAHDYDEKGFFFIAHRARSVNPVNHGRTVFQFNYRWPRLKTFPPDNYCMDEVVEIAQGLYLGQLNYATNLALPYEPSLDPTSYRYKNFGFFLLMDEDWQKRREEISFDIPGK